jgi:long-chain acyl-CoA synthetase
MGIIFLIMCIKPAPLYTLLQNAADQWGDAPALNFLGKITSFAELDERSNVFAAGLQALGVNKGDRVGVMLPNSALYIIAYYGILKAGGIVVNYNPLYAVQELRHQITDSGTRFMVSFDLCLTWDKLKIILDANDTGLEGVIIAPFPQELPFPQNVLFPIFKHAQCAKITRNDRVIDLQTLLDTNHPWAMPDIDPLNDVALLQYTGGTTGVPKGAMLTHSNLLTNTEQCRLCLPEVTDGAGHKMVAVLPFFHVFAMTATLNLSLRMGLQIITTPRFDLIQTLKIIDREQPLFFAAVPAILNAMTHCDSIDRYDLKSLQYCVSGGAPLPLEVKKSFEARTGAVILEGYGLTEASPVLTLNSPKDNRAGTIGTALPDTDIRLMDLNHPDAEVPTGQKGELCAKGAQIMKGYWNNPNATAATMMNGYLRTGDVAVKDEDGYFTIVDRIKDLILINGYNVYPRQVEEAIYKHKAVEECIVAGIPDPQRGEVAKAWIKFKSGMSASEAELKEFLKDHLSATEIPRVIEFRNTPLPKTMIGKLSRKMILSEEGAQ